MSEVTGSNTTAQSEESRRGVMLEPQVLEGSALMTKVESSSTQEKGKAESTRISGRDNKNALWCNYCKKSRHTKENCSFSLSLGKLIIKGDRFFAEKPLQFWHYRFAPGAQHLSRGRRASARGRGGNRSSAKTDP